MQCLNWTRDFDYDRYHRMLATADDEPKRLALIKLLIEEKAMDRLADHSLRTRLTGLGLNSPRRD